VFLDPYGMQVEWSLIEEIARTRAIDLWVLFPLGVAVNRLLTSDKPPPDEWAQALDRIFGSTEWTERFYPSEIRDGLFGREETREKHADFKCIADFFVQRLERVFSGVARNPLALVNSRSVPIYLLCFAVGNQRGVKAALRIAEHILRQNGGRTSRRKAR
jgi:three-Cys-motif partner protein